MSASGGRLTGKGDRGVLIARVLADQDALSEHLAPLLDALAAHGVAARYGDGPGSVAELIADAADARHQARFRAAIEAHLPAADVLIAGHVPVVPGLFVSDMDSTMIGQECIDELADFAGLKPQIAAITERAMQGELDFASALHERVVLLAGLDEGAITQCLAQRITPMPGAAVLAATLKAKGCRTVLVTGGFHQFADPVAKSLGFERVAANQLEIAGGKLTGRVSGRIVTVEACRFHWSLETTSAGRVQTCSRPTGSPKSTSHSVPRRASVTLEAVAICAFPRRVLVQRIGVSG